MSQEYPTKSEEKEVPPTYVDLTDEIFTQGETESATAEAKEPDESEVSQAINQIDAIGDSDLVEDQTELYDEDRLEAMRDLLDDHNLRIIQQLLASDTGALSPREVAFRNEDIITDSTVRDHLRTLTEKGLAEKLEPDVESVPNRMPRTFYAATPLAIELLQQMGLWDNLGMLYQIYDSLDRPDDVVAIENWDDRPSPDWI